MSRENFNKKWSLDIVFDPNNIIPSSSFSNSLLTIKHQDEVIDEFRVNEGLMLFGSNGFFGVQINTSTDHYPKGEVTWEINMILDDINVLHDEGKIIMVGKPTKEKVARPWDLLNPKTKYVTKEIAEKRLSICESCDDYFKQFCKNCGCYMPIKSKMEIASCPIGKW